MHPSRSMHEIIITVPVYTNTCTEAGILTKKLGQATSRVFSCIMDEKQAPANLWASLQRRCCDIAVDSSPIILSQTPNRPSPPCSFQLCSILPLCLFFGILIHLLLSLSLSLSLFLCSYLRLSFSPSYSISLYLRLYVSLFLFFSVSLNLCSSSSLVSPSLSLCLLVRLRLTPTGSPDK